MYQEAEAVKRRKRYARPLVDKHMDVYRKEGLKPWSAENLPLPSGKVMSRVWIHLKFAKSIQVLKDTTNRYRDLVVLKVIIVSPEGS